MRFYRQTEHRKAGSVSETPKWESKSEQDCRGMRVCAWSDAIVSSTGLLYGTDFGFAASVQVWRF